MVGLLGAGRDRHVEQGVAEILGGFGAGLGEQVRRTPERPTRQAPTTRLGSKQQTGYVGAR